ncbi:hypothetical protein COV23_00965 [Candidatus Wolfebacteria bacterium CG10_big_fil_rev_8_21_14_0_10_31_9]|uniref:PD-(D/E)XK endonuclease-like domain-containing protein n=1 Tax=Candidatus Wolfebacteria bacterium CG10_big_fil_rev_8_21_14_0_10_31_9 TaxID=1975070 RepID=A0A2H0RCX2_9BACT|nr:MAG: hypothetical protein COV23_00965 [Candidatus Wolfebacteria bacterium CG10_big_fil_rev_8_21_14_0_10_31_9]
MYYTDKNHFKSLSGYEIGSTWYPRVTKIVEIKSKPALYKFYAELDSFQQGEDIKNNSAAEGTLIHEAVEKILVGESPVIDPSIEPSIRAFYKFLEKRNIQTDLEYIEKQVVNYDDRYAGTLDALAIIDGKFGVLDIKTSQAIYRDYNLQTSAYMGALEKQFKNLQTRWILRIDQNKKCLKCGAILRSKGGREKIRSARIGSKLLPMCNEKEHRWSELEGEVELQEFPYWKEDYKAFLGAKKLWEWENEYWLNKVGYL